MGNGESGGRSAGVSPGPGEQSARRWRPGGAATARDQGNGRDASGAAEHNNQLGLRRGRGRGRGGHDTRSYRLECGTECRIED